MARKAVKKAVKRAATVSKKYIVGWKTEFASAPDFLQGIYDTLEKAKAEAEDSADDGDTFYVYEVKLVAESERINRLTWKGK